jgi:hypothetical protein
MEAAMEKAFSGMTKEVLKGFPTLLDFYNTKAGFYGLYCMSAGVKMESLQIPSGVTGALTRVSELFPFVPKIQIWVTSVKARAQEDELTTSPGSVHGRGCIIEQEGSRSALMEFAYLYVFYERQDSDTAIVIRCWSKTKYIIPAENADWYATPAAEQCMKLDAQRRIIKEFLRVMNIKDDGDDADVHKLCQLNRLSRDESGDVMQELMSKCPQGHDFEELTQELVKSRSLEVGGNPRAHYFICDMCRSRFSRDPSLPSFVCRPCDFDMCGRCSYAAVGWQQEDDENQQRDEDDEDE